MYRKLVSASLLALALSFDAGAALAQGGAKITFLTNYVFHGRHSPFFVGLEKGFYKEAGFDIAIQPATGSGFVLSALEGNKADYGMADAGTVVQAVAKGAKAKAFAVFMDISPNGVASLRPLPTPQSIGNAPVAAGLTDSIRVTLPIIYKLNGLDPASIQWVATDPSAYMSLLLGGRVDVITATVDGDIPAIRKVADQQGKTVHFSAFAGWGYDVFGFVMVTRAERIADKPDEVKRFSAATAKAVAYALANPEETVQIMVKHNPTLDPTTTLAQWKQSMLAINTDYVKKHGYGAATPERVQRTIDLVREALKIEAQLKPEDVLAPGFVAPRVSN